MKDNCQRLQERVNAPLLADSELIAYAVTDQVVLAGQPEPEDWQRLVQDGYDLIINMRSDPERAAVQAQRAQAAGLKYSHLQVPAYELEAEHVHAFQNTLTSANGSKVLVHCRTASRVALMWMLHRMINEGWTQSEAEKELENAGYGGDDMDVFRFCTEDFLEREATLELYL
jgi:uncharacterized protein (TIGR01244 family)